MIGAATLNQERAEATLRINVIGVMHRLVRQGAQMRQAMLTPCHSCRSQELRTQATEIKESCKNQ